VLVVNESRTAKAQSDKNQKKIEEKYSGAMNAFYVSRLLPALHSHTSTLFFLLQRVLAGP
jgi:hypothetical protein